MMLRPDHWRSVGSIPMGLARLRRRIRNTDGVIFRLEIRPRRQRSNVLLYCYVYVPTYILLLWLFPE